MAEIKNYDFIVVGAGAAGCCVAARLSEASGATVLLVEAGKGRAEVPEDVVARVDNPSVWYTLLGSEIDWGYNTVPQPGLNGRSIYEPRGKMSGGSSNLYIMMHIRGHRSDYDNWAYNGCPGWGYDDVLPYFQRLEDQEDDTNPTGGKGGAIRVANAKLHNPNPASEIFIEACQELGYPLTEDFNGPQMEGTGWHHVNIKDGKRHSAAAAYLTPVLNRQNLTVITQARTTRLLFEGTRCTGIEYIRDGKLQTAKANCEVVICAGAIESPKLLLLSGVGDSTALKALGIPVVADLPGVGENFHNHVLTGVIAESKLPIPQGNQNLSEAALFCKSSAGCVAPDFQFSFVHVPFNIIVGQGHPNSVSILPGVVRPTSRGWIRLASADPEADPLINPNYLATKYDLDRMVQAVGICRDIFRSKAFEPWVKQELMPGPDIQGETELIDFVRNNADSYHHQAGSCKMGSDEASVVDPELRVYGIEGLRIADASVMPAVPSGNCHAGIVMIGERVSELLLKKYSYSVTAP